MMVQLLQASTPSVLFSTLMCVRLCCRERQILVAAASRTPTPQVARAFMHKLGTQPNDARAAAEVLQQRACLLQHRPGWERADRHIASALVSATGGFRLQIPSNNTTALHMASQSAGDDVCVVCRRP